MGDHELDPRIENLAWQTMIVSLFRHSERQTLNLITSVVGVSTPEDAYTLIRNIFHLVRKSVIYIPEARLKILLDAPELVDVYLIKNFDESMVELAQELNELRIEATRLSEIKEIPQKVLIDLKNYAAGRYTEKVQS
ncbi:MAG: hypothetical protein ACXADY_17055 [Candidatus Hodarchaeales archaeon]|jgi:hypothetical protein